MRRSDSRHLHVFPRDLWTRHVDDSVDFWVSNKLRSHVHVMHLSSYHKKMNGKLSTTDRARVFKCSLIELKLKVWVRSPMVEVWILAWKLLLWCEFVTSSNFSVKLLLFEFWRENCYLCDFYREELLLFGIWAWKLLLW